MIKFSRTLSFSAMLSASTLFSLVSFTYSLPTEACSPYPTYALPESNPSQEPFFSDSWLVFDVGSWGADPSDVSEPLFEVFSNGENIPVEVRLLGVDDVTIGFRPATYRIGLRSLDGWVDGESYELLPSEAWHRLVNAAYVDDSASGPATLVLDNSGDIQNIDLSEAVYTFTAQIDGSSPMVNISEPVLVQTQNFDGDRANTCGSKTGGTFALDCIYEGAGAEANLGILYLHLPVGESPPAESDSRWETADFASAQAFEYDASTTRYGHEFRIVESQDLYARFLRSNGEMGPISAYGFTSHVENPTNDYSIDVHYSEISTPDLSTLCMFEGAIDPVDPSDPDDPSSVDDQSSPLDPADASESSEPADASEATDASEVTDPNNPSDGGYNVVGGGPGCAQSSTDALWFTLMALFAWKRRRS